MNVPWTTTEIRCKCYGITAREGVLGFERIELRLLRLEHVRALQYRQDRIVDDLKQFERHLLSIWVRQQLQELTRLRRQREAQLEEQLAGLSVPNVLSDGLGPPRPAPGLWLICTACTPSLTRVDAPCSPPR